MVSLAKVLKHEVSDGIIAPDYDEDAFEILSAKKKGAYTVIKIDENYVPAPIETRTVFGITFEQGRNDSTIDESLLSNIETENKNLPRKVRNATLLLRLSRLNTPSPTPFAMLKTDKRSEWARGSNPAFTAHALRAIKPTFGTCARILQC